MLNERKMNKVYQAAIYIRLSREDGDKEESNSVDNQRLMLSRFVENQEDMVLYDEYVDDGYTGTNFDRPAFRRMINDIEQKSVNCVIVKDLSRFGRDYIDTGNYIEKYFVDADIRFVSINDNIDSQRDQYDMIIPIKNIFNQQYAMDISKKVQSSFKVRQREGLFIGAFASYGDGTNRRIAFAVLVSPVFQVHVDGYRPVGQLRGIEGCKVTHSFTSLMSRRGMYAERILICSLWFV